MPRLSLLGSAVMGLGVTPTSVNGSVPAGLAGSVGGGWAWLSNTTIIGAADFGTGYSLYTLVLPSTLATLAAGGINQVAAGANVYATWTTGVGVVTNIPGLPLLPFAGVGDIGGDGYAALVNNRAAGMGLVVYATDGTTALDLSETVLSSLAIRVRGGLLSYQSSDGWHLLDIAAAKELTWLHRTAAIDLTIPVVVDGPVWVLERESATTRLTLRVATSTKALIINDTGLNYGPDVILLSSGVVRIGWSTSAAESAADLVLLDVTVATGATVRGVVVAGAIVWTDDAPRVRTVVTVTSTGVEYPPYKTPFLDLKTNTVTKVWFDYLKSLANGLQSAQIDINNLQPVTVPPPGFGRMAVAGLDTVAAAVPNDEMTFIMGPGMAAEVDPVLKTIELEATAANRPGPPGQDGVDGQDTWPIPGPPGPAGVAGSPGATGPGGFGMPGMDGDDGFDGFPGATGATGATGTTGPTGPSGSPGPPGSDGEDAGEGYVIVMNGAAGVPGTAAGVAGDVQLNVAGALGVDTGLFTYNTAGHKLSVNNVGAQAATTLAITGGVATGANGGGVTITGGATGNNGTSGGSVTVAAGSPSGGTSTTAGSVTVKSGDALFTSGTVTITTGSIPAVSSGLSSTAITIQPATPTSAGSGTGVTGAGTLVAGGPGQANGNNAGGAAGGVLALAGGAGGANARTNASATAGAGGVASLAGGIGGADTGSGAGNTLTGGAGGNATVSGGGGGAANGASGTRNGGNGGKVVLAGGAAGVGTTTTGLAGYVESQSPIIATGTKPVLSGSTTSTQVGGAFAGSFVSTVTGASAVTMTFPVTAPNGWVVMLTNTTAGVAYAQTGGTATTAVVGGVTTTGDVIRFIAMGY